MRWDDESIPMIFVEAISCPHCHQVKPIIVKTLDGGDGSKSRRCVCRSCSMRFVVVIELPEPCHDLADIENRPV